MADVAEIDGLSLHEGFHERETGCERDGWMGGATDLVAGPSCEVSGGKGTTGGELWQEEDWWQVVGGGDGWERGKSGGAADEGERRDRARGFRVSLLYQEWLVGLWRAWEGLSGLAGDVLGCP